MVYDSNPRICYAVFVSHVIINTFPPPDSLEFQETTDVSRIAQTGVVCDIRETCRRILLHVA
jgi:hypothetical protein